VDAHDDIRDPQVVELARAERHDDGSWRYEGNVPLERRGAFGYTVRVLPRHPALAAPAELALVALPSEPVAYTAV
jgi:starch phosphorylase